MNTRIDFDPVPVATNSRQEHEEQPNLKKPWNAPKLYDLTSFDTEAHDFTASFEFSSLGRQYGPES
jgi:hypothetical protein